MAKRRVFLLTIGLLILEWTLFKLAYPYPDFILDSYYYIGAARDNLDINIWPIGYSKFLEVFHYITDSDTALVSFQFFFLELAALYFYTTINATFQLGASSIKIIYLFLFCNPLFFYLSNSVLSDPIFAALSILWFTELLNLIQKPQSFWSLCPQALFVGIAFTFRYNAMYYPAITGVALILSHYRPFEKLAGTLLVLLLIIPFLVYSKNAGKKLTGEPIYSFLAGWQLANNALYMRNQIEVDTTKFPSSSSMKIDSLSRAFFRRAGPHFKSYLNNYAGNYFIQEGRGPLKTFMWITNKDYSLKTWGQVNIPYSEYGRFLIKSHPIGYIRYFLIPNSKSYFFPPLADIAYYNYASDSVAQIAKEWFSYPSRRITVFSKTIQGYILKIFPIFFLALNAFFPIGYLLFLRQYHIRKKSSNFSKPFILASTFLIINAVFSITANGACLRYEFTPMIIFLSFSCMLLDAFENNTATPHKNF